MPGLGHPIPKPIDPRTVRLFEIARETGHYGQYCKLIEEIAKARGITLNATGALGALACEPGLHWKAAPGLGLTGRAGGRVGHIPGEKPGPMATRGTGRAAAATS